MHKVLRLTIVLLFSVLALAGSKDTGSTMLKDVQPAGTTNKNHKHQQYDLTLIASGREYTCRTNEKSEIKATDFIVGSTVTYEFKDNKGKVKSASGKKVDCTIVRVANSLASSP
jgi:gentisate 1,2-dioxygenase